MGMKVSECVYKIITPLSVSGALPKSVEIRPASVKGMMRFWWRAVNGDIPLSKLKEREGSIFGSTAEKQGKSKFNLRILASDLKYQQYPPVYHRQAPKTMTAYIPEQKFCITLSSRGDDEKHQMYENILTLSLMLGGLGKRSRRGFGSVQLHSLNGAEMSWFNSQEKYTEKLDKLLNELKPDCFYRHNNKILSLSTFAGDYPWIQEIAVGKAYPDFAVLLKAISIAAHQSNSSYTGMGGREGRFASPVYVSVAKIGQEYRPIVITLNTAFKPGFNVRGTNTQGQFKEAIL